LIKKLSAYCILILFYFTRFQIPETEEFIIYLKINYLQMQNYDIYACIK